jgi:hypothetical protein
VTAESTSSWTTRPLNGETRQQQRPPHGKQQRHGAQHPRKHSGRHRCPHYKHATNTNRVDTEFWQRIATGHRNQAPACGLV